MPLPENESARLANLKSLRVLDTPPERAFDDLAYLTSYICGTPFAFIGFMDSDRLWFKSRIGWDVPEVPRDMSFCAHTILQSDVLVVCDTLEDDGRSAICPLAAHGGMRFYAGAPLMSSDGYALGTVCAMDTIPRGLTPGQTEALRRLARTVVSLIESRCNVSKPPFTLNSIQPGTESANREPKVQGFSFWRNISEQKRTDDVVRYSEERLRGIINSAMDAIVTIDSQQRIVVFNKAAEQIFRCATSEALGQSIDRFIPERFRSIHRQHIQGFGNTGVTSRSMTSPGILLGLRADGEEFPIEATISQVEAENERLFTVILRDIGARLRTEAELRQAQKIEAVGQLAGGIAHEFNNFLGIILGYNELLAEEAIANEKLARYVTEIRSATQHAASLTRQLLAFGRKQVPEPQILDLNRCIWEGHNLLRRLVPANIDIVTVLAPTVGHVRADPGQLQQILINLFVNARDAMPDGGKVIVETSNAELDEAYASQHVGVQPGCYVVLSVSDTGSGMNSETRSHLFEPFYTTKEPGKGTGLGLSTIYGIVKHNGGYINVESAEGKGTTFRIFLPRIEAATEGSIATPRPVEQAKREPTTILVVEDEAALRRLLLTTLERRGYRVLAAKDGVEAIEALGENADIQLVVTDLMMPRMDGFELRKRVAELGPKVRFIFMSGYAEEIVEQHGGSLNGCSFLEKPFLPEELANEVEIVLRAGAAA